MCGGASVGSCVMNGPTIAGDPARTAPPAAVASANMAERAIADLLRARFASQRLSDRVRVGTDPAAVARAVCGVQAQELNSGLLSLRARSVGLTRESAIAAFDRGGSLAWTWLMRGTLHACAADDLRWMLSLFGPLNAARDATRRAHVNLDDDTCARGLRVVRNALAGGPLTRHQLRETLLARGVDVLRDPQALIHLIALAAALGVIVVLPPVGRDNRFALLDDWIAPAPALTREAAEAELARRYFTAFGPAAIADFRAWAGIPAPMAQRATSLISSELEEVQGPLPALLRMRGAHHSGNTAAAATVRLLPRWDTYLLGYRARDLMLHPSHAPRVCIGGVIKPTVCVEGSIAGSWELRRERTGWRIELMPFGKVSRALGAAVVAEADNIATFLDAPVQLTDADLR